MVSPIKTHRKKITIILLIVAPLVALFISLFMGRYLISPSTVFDLLLSKVVPMQPAWPSTVETVVFNVRLPRAIAAILVGASLAVSGVSFQGMFKNPLVDTYILGVSSGAGFGAALGFVVSNSFVVVEVLAFACGLLSMIATYAISKIYKTTSTITLALAGIVVSAFFSALLSMLKYVADPNEKLPAIVFWLMGSLARVTWSDILPLAPIMIIGMSVLVLIRWRINVLSMGDEDAAALGINTERLKIVVIICCTLITSAAVCVCGIIGWVGLIIPHIARALVGPDHKALVPAAISIGAVYILLVDDLARTLIAAELPLGVLTGLIGAPIFAYLLKRGVKWQ
jgi:iron complex transport system permease protein